MGLVSELNGTLTLIGGLSGAAVLIYMTLMVYFARQRDAHIQELRVQLAKIEGMLLMKKKN